MRSLELLTNIKNILDKRIIGEVTLSYSVDSLITVEIKTTYGKWLTKIADHYTSQSPFAQAYTIAESIIAEYRQDILSQFLK
jgi:hypothetical protein